MNKKQLFYTLLLPLFFVVTRSEGAKNINFTFNLNIKNPIIIIFENVSDNILKKPYWLPTIDEMSEDEKKIFKRYFCKDISCENNSDNLGKNPIWAQIFTGTNKSKTKTGSRIKGKYEKKWLSSEYFKKILNPKSAD